MLPYLKFGSCYSPAYTIPKYRHLQLSWLLLQAMTAVSRLCDQHYQEFTCTLKCGQLEARVQLFPEPHPAVHEGYAATYTLSNELNIIGFVHQNELGKPVWIDFFGKKCTFCTYVIFLMSIGWTKHFRCLNTLIESISLYYILSKTQKRLVLHVVVKLIRCLYGQVNFYDRDIT